MNIKENQLSISVVFTEVLDLPLDTFLETIELILDLRFGE